MELISIGVNHRTAPLEVRERLAPCREGLSRALGLIQGYVQEGAILSTCNRVEVYGVAEDGEEGAKGLLSLLCHLHYMPAERFEPHLYTFRGREAVRHLFRVAAGLDSMIVGEPQILGQVREAWETALAGGHLGPSLGRLFQRAVEAGKLVRSRTAIAHRAASVSYAAVELARQTLGDLRGRTVFLCGAGKIGGLTGKALKDAGCSSVMVTSRTAGRASELAQRFGWEVIPSWQAFEQHLVRADVVIVSTSAPHYLLRPQAVQGALEARDGLPLLIIDLSVPRNVDPAVGEIAGVQIYNVDDLKVVVEGNLERRREEGVKAEAIVEGEVERFWGWWQRHSTRSAIATLNSWAEGLRQQELARSLRRLKGQDEETQQAMEALSRSLVQKLLARPTAYLKATPGREGERRAGLICQLFDLSAPGSETGLHNGRCHDG